MWYRLYVTVYVIHYTLYNTITVYGIIYTLYNTIAMGHS